MKRKQTIPIIDLFAGPGGLGEGFSAYGRDKGISPFQISLSIEKDQYAHQTLLLRSFFRQFPYGKVPIEYYRFIKNNREKHLDELFSLFPSEGDAARNEARCAELGGKDTPTEEIDLWIKSSLNSAENWVLIGGPPCQAYSTVGRSRNKRVKGYRPENDERHFLYREYLRIIANHWPTVFVMENVRGLLSSKVKERYIFPKILDDLRNPSKIFNGNGNNRKHRYIIYSFVTTPKSMDVFGFPAFMPSDFTIQCEDYGIPQARHRVILLGIRDDLNGYAPGILQPSDGKVSAEEVLGDLPALRSGISRGKDSAEGWLETLLSIQDEQWVFDLAENGQDEDIANEIFSQLQELEIPKLGRGEEFIRYKVGCAFRKEWFHDWRLRGVCNSVTKEHMLSDLKRYFFAACFAAVRGRSPLLSEFPEELQPAHKNASRAVGTNNFADRFRVQLRNRPSTTVMSHISKDGHYYIHYDPQQCRSMTVREAARLQTFPDNYCFMGNRTKQYTQVGNAVPPLLALQLAEIVYSFLTEAV